MCHRGRLSVVCVSSAARLANLVSDFFVQALQQSHGAQGELASQLGSLSHYTVVKQIIYVYSKLCAAATYDL